MLPWLSNFALDLRKSQEPYNPDHSRTNIANHEVCWSYSITVDHLLNVSLLRSRSPFSGSACLFLSSELSGFGCPQLRPCSPSRLCLGLCQSQAVAEPAHLSPQLFEGLKAFRARDRSVRLFRPWLNMDRMLRSAVRLSLPVSGAGRPGAGRGRGPP